jgi:predicted P-loop ATPase
LDQWLTLYLGADASNFTRAASARWLTSAVARAFQPGAKADCCLILEGSQGIGKSSALRLLGGEWFTDDLPDLGTKDSALQLRGVWIVEISELASFRGIEANRIKAFISRQSDRYRPPYARKPIEAPRQCVFAGTANQSVYLHDETGGRRFWTFRCGCLKADELARDRDQLWAEALLRYRSGAPWWLDSDELNKEAEVAQRQRLEEDAWEEKIAIFVEGKDFLTIPQILNECLDIAPKAQDQRDSNRVSRCLQGLGFKRTQKRVDDRRTWVYVPKEAGER